MRHIIPLPGPSPRSSPSILKVSRCQLYAGACDNTHAYSRRRRPSSPSQVPRTHNRHRRSRGRGSGDRRATASRRRVRAAAPRTRQGALAPGVGRRLLRDRRRRRTRHHHGASRRRRLRRRARSRDRTRAVEHARRGDVQRARRIGRSGRSATPAIDGARRVRGRTARTSARARRAPPASERWRHDLVAEFGAVGARPTASPRRRSSSGDLVIVPTGGPKSRGLLAFNRDDGTSGVERPAREERWRTRRPLSPRDRRRAPDRRRRPGTASSPSRRLTAGLLWSVAGPGADKELATSPIVLPGRPRPATARGTRRVMLKVTRRRRTRCPRASSGGLRACARTTGRRIYRDGFLYGVAGPQLRVP